MNKQSIRLSFLALVLSVAYFFYAYYVLHLSEPTMPTTDNFIEFFRQLNIIALALGIIINSIALVFKSRFLVLSAATLYTISIVFNLPLFYFLIIQVVLLLYSYYYGIPERDGLI